MNSILRMWVPAVGLVLALAGSPLVLAQNTTPPEGFDQTSATVEAVMNQAVKNIAKRYNLNEYQIAQTDQLMKTEVRRFLIEHEAEIWPAIRSMLTYGMGSKPPTDPDEAREFAQRMRPLAKLAGQAIFESNDRWHEILDDQQRRIHDFDMQEMRKTFTHIDGSLSAWEDGRANETPIFPGTPAKTPPPPPSQPPPVQGLGNPVVSTPNPDILRTIVEEFIKDYGLDEGQTNSAQSILAEFRGKAVTFQRANRDAFARLDAEEDDAARKRDIKAKKAAALKRKELLKPFYEIIEEMQGRLKGLLTSAQLETYQARHGIKPAKSETTAAEQKKSAKQPAEKKAKPKKEQPDKPEKQVEDSSDDKPEEPY